MAELVMKVPNKIRTGYHALSLSYDHHFRKVTAMVHGMREDEWMQIVAMLRDFIHLCFHPIFLPSLVFIVYQRSCEMHRAALDESIFTTERETGYGVPGRMLDQRYKWGVEFGADQVFDFESLLRRLHSYQTELITLANVLRFSDDLGAFLAKNASEIGRSSSTDDKIASECQEILHLLELPRSQIRTAQSQVQSLAERVQSQTTLVS
jgi:hypothetical protein